MGAYIGGVSYFSKQMQNLQIVADKLPIKEEMVGKGNVG